MVVTTSTYDRPPTDRARGRKLDLRAKTGRGHAGGGGRARERGRARRPGLGREAGRESGAGRGGRAWGARPGAEAGPGRETRGRARGLGAERWWRKMRDVTGSGGQVRG